MQTVHSTTHHDRNVMEIFFIKNIKNLFSLCRLVSFIAPLLNKPVERFNWVLETDKKMSKVFKYSNIFLWSQDLKTLGLCYIKF